MASQPKSRTAGPTLSGVSFNVSGKPGKHIPSKPPKHAIATRVHVRLTELKRSRRWLAKTLGIPTSTLHSWFRGGATSIPAVAVVPIALVLDVNPLWLLCVLSDPTPERIGIRKEVATLNHNLEMTQQVHERIDEFAKLVLEGREALSQAHQQVGRMKQVAQRTAESMEGIRVAPNGGR